MTQREVDEIEKEVMSQRYWNTHESLLCQEGLAYEERADYTEKYWICIDRVKIELRITLDWWAYFKGENFNKL